MHRFLGSHVLAPALRLLGAVLMAAWALGCPTPGAQRVPDPAPGAQGESTADDRAATAADGKPAEGWASTLSVDHPLVGRIWSVAEARFVARAALEERARKARFVLLGEQHDNADHHRLQAAMVRVVAESGRAPSVVFEMIDHSLQAAVDERLASAPDDVDGFGQAIGWAESGWPDWQIYRPIFAAVLHHHLPIIAAQLPRKEAMGLARGGALPEDLVRQYKLDEPMPEKLEKALLGELMASHCGHMPESMMQPMMNVQRARDAIMADKLTRHATDGGAMLIAGGGHVRADRGVPWYTGVPAKDMVTIGFVEVADGADTPAAYAERYDGAIPFDYLWFTPRDNDIDHCKELEERMKHMKAGQDSAAAPKSE